jgi:hypothetical protein
MANSAKKQQSEERKAPIYERRRRLAEIRGEVDNDEDQGGEDGGEGEGDGDQAKPTKKMAKRAKR